jgi:hypothetical protein
MKQPLLGTKGTKKQNFKHESYRQNASVNEVDSSVDSSMLQGTFNFNSGMGA